MLEAKEIEKALQKSIRHMQEAPGAPKLGDALEYAVFPGGGRIRPQLCMEVANACGYEDERLVISSCLAVELIHCASLVHDDLPCFDNALLRRGKDSTHIKFGEPLAILAGDSLIVRAFEELAAASSGHSDKLVPLITMLGKSTGMPAGICSGQGWESEREIDLSSYHRLKTSSLFVAASQMGAVSAGSDPEPWLGLGECIGEAFQIADDLRDYKGSEESIGKPINQDVFNNRPNAAMELGSEGARCKIKDVLEKAILSIPECSGKDQLVRIVQKQAKVLMSAGSDGK